MKPAVKKITDLLTNREIEILRCIADGLNTKQIAEKLFISENTVFNHRRNMLHKTASKTTAQLLGDNINLYLR